MTDIAAIIAELNADNGTNHKMEVLKRHADNPLLKRVLKMTYDKAAFSYGILPNQADQNYNPLGPKSLTLESALNWLESDFATRRVTGNAAKRVLGDIFQALSASDKEVFFKIVNRDLRINMGRSNINKVIPGLITKPAYMRCGIYSEKTAKKFDPKGAFVQLKADGTYREFSVDAGSGQVTCQSRQGEEYDYPEINAVLLSKGISAVYFGELTVYRDGLLLDRATGNGLLRKHEFPDNCKVVFDCWDMVGHEEYAKAVARQKTSVLYEFRWMMVQRLFPDHTADPLTNPVRAIEGIKVQNMSEALAFTAEVMNRGLEGTIIKERTATFKDGTSAQQLKLKLEIDVDVRITGFHEGTPGTAREATFGAMTFETDDGLIKGRTSGFTDAQLKDFNDRRAELIGQIMTVQCNDITKARDHDFHALSHPRFIELRDDKSETDTLERALESKQMAMMVDQKAA